MDLVLAIARGIVREAIAGAASWSAVVPGVIHRRPRSFPVGTPSASAP